MVRRHPVALLQVVRRPVGHHPERAHRGYPQRLGHQGPFPLERAERHRGQVHLLEADHHRGLRSQGVDRHRAHPHREHPHQVVQEILAQGNPSAAKGEVQRVGFFGSQ